MSCITHRLRRVAAIAGQARLTQIDEVLRTEPSATRALLECHDAKRIALALARVCARIEMESEAHAARLAVGMRMLGARLGLSDERLDHLELGALVHDVGKLSTSDDVLKSGEVLGPGELDGIRMHCSLGHAIIAGVSGLERAATLVLHHHEYWDGTGYSEGRKGTDIPEDARIFAVVDSYEAIVRDDRVFRVGQAHDEARAEIIALAGVRYDPEIVAAFASIDAREWADVWLRLEG
jgi:HD-GYP domain-containing protein (c-di-GMP phosphodiesterase class II)